MVNDNGSMDGYESSVLCFVVATRKKKDIGFDWQNDPDLSQFVKEVCGCLRGEPGTYSERVLNMVRYLEEWADKG